MSVIAVAGLTPAGAGSTSNVFVPGTLSVGLPPQVRRCGEHDKIAAVVAGLTGLPPQVRRCGELTTLLSGSPQVRGAP